MDDCAIEERALLEDLERRDLFVELGASGCVFMISAVESLSDTVLTILEKHHTRADVAEATTDPEARPILIEITGLTKDITPGLTYNVAFNFKQNGTVQVQVPVDAGTTARHESDKSGAAEAEHTGGH